MLHYLRLWLHGTEQHVVFTSSLSLPVGDIDCQIDIDAQTRGEGDTYSSAPQLATPRDPDTLVEMHMYQ